MYTLRYVDKSIYKQTHTYTICFKSGKSSITEGIMRLVSNVSYQQKNMLTKKKMIFNLENSLIFVIVHINP